MLIVSLSNPKSYYTAISLYDKYPSHEPDLSPKSLLLSHPRKHTPSKFHGLRTRNPSFEGAAARLNELSHSSHARPAPKPNPTYAGHARRLKRRTEKTMPKERPRPERMSMEERQRSHFSFKSASLIGRFVLATAVVGAPEGASDMVCMCLRPIDFVKPVAGGVRRHWRADRGAGW